MLKKEMNMTDTTRQTLADNWARDMRLIREEANDKREAIYQAWLSSDMSIVDRDNRMAAVSAVREAQIEMARKAWYYGLALIEQAA